MRRYLKKGFTLVELMIVVAIIGILAAIAIPNFIRFQARSKQAEAKTNLKAIFTGQKSRFGERDNFSTINAEIGFQPERGNRYRYDLGIGTGAAAAAGLAVNCTSLEPRDVPSANSALYCGIQEDIYRYSAGVTPGVAGNAATVNFETAVAGNAAIVADSTGITGTCPQCDFSAKAVGNVDNDSSGDVFYVASQFASMVATACAEGATNEQPGAPVNSNNDVGCEQ